MRTLTYQFLLIYRNLLIIISLLLLSIGCSSRAEKEFREANGNIVAVDSTYHISIVNLDARILESGVYKIEFNEDIKKYIWFRSLVTDDIISMDFIEYRNVVDRKILRPATSTDIQKAMQEKATRSKIIAAHSIDLQSFVLTTGAEYHGDKIMKAIDAIDSKAKYRPDQTILFRLEDKYYYVGTEKITFDYPAIYRITFIKYKRLPWKGDDF